MTTKAKGTDLMRARYERAQALDAGTCTKNVVRNATLFPNWIAGTECFWYERETEAGRQYRLVDAIALTNKPAFDHDLLAEKLVEIKGQSVDPENLSIRAVTISLSPLRVIFNAFGKRWCFDDQKKTCEETEAPHRGWLISPDGKRAAFVRDHNLWLRELESGAERPLTVDGESRYAYATARDAWGDDVQARWSPDSKRLFTLQHDTRQMKTLPVVQHVPQDGSLRPVVTDVLGGMPGDDHLEEYRLVAIEVDTGAIVEANHRRVNVIRDGRGYFDVDMAWWGNDARRAWFIDVERGFRAIRVMEFDTFTGATRVTLEETADTYISLEANIEDCPLLRPLPETDELIWYSTRSGAAHLYLYDLKAGRLKNPITAGDWMVRDVLHFDPVRRQLFIQTAGRVAGRDPYYRDICRVHVDTGELATIVASDHEYVALSRRSFTWFGFRGYGRDLSDATKAVSDTANYVVTTRSRADETPVSLLLDREGREMLEVEHADVSGLPENWQWPEPVKLVAADGKTDIYGIVFRPSDFSPDERYAVIDYMANFPDEAAVSKGSFSNEHFLGMFYFACAALAELGFIVVMIDGRGSGHRPNAFQQESYGWVASASNLEDHVAGIRQLAERYPYIDLERVGVTGWEETAGPAHALLEHPQFFKVGVAMNMMDSRLSTAALYLEKYEGRSPDREGRRFPEELAHNLEGKLLLIHGMLRTASPPCGMFRLVDALQKANKEFDMLVLPNAGHMTPGYGLRRCWDYLVRHLQGREPPKDFALKRNVEILLEEIWARGIGPDAA